MRRILPIIVSALALAGCADGYDKSAGINDCDRAASVGRPVFHTNLNNSGTFESSFAGIPGQDLSGGRSDLLPDGTSTYRCAHHEDNKTNKPHDLQKIGRLHAPGSRPV